MSESADRAARMARALSAFRAAIGVSAIGAPVMTARVFGFPRADINTSAVTLGRLFGVREIGVAAFTVSALRRDAADRRAYLINAMMDGGDGLVALAGMLSRRRPDKGSVMTALTALPVAVTWLRLGGRAAS